MQNSTDNFKDLIKETSSCASNYGVEISLPKNRGRPRLDGNYQQPEEFYHNLLFVPLLKFISRELKEKFKENSVLSCFNNLM